MIEALITNKTRIKLLIRFFLDPDSSSYLRGLEEDFGESTNAIRLELNRFEAAGLLKSWESKNKKMFAANKEHPLFLEIRSILRKYAGIDTLVEKVIKNLGHPDAAYIHGLIQPGNSGAPVQLTIFGNNLDDEYLQNLLEKCSHLLHRPVIGTILSEKLEGAFLAENPDAMIIWKSNREL